VGRSFGHEHSEVVMIHFNCPYCGRALACPEESAGETAPCPRCETPVSVPAATETAQAIALPAATPIRRRPHRPETGPEPPPSELRDQAVSPEQVTANVPFSGPVPGQQHADHSEPVLLPEEATPPSPTPSKKIRIPRHMPEVPALGAPLDQFFAFETARVVILGYLMPLVLGTLGLGLICCLPGVDQQTAFNEASFSLAFGVAFLLGPVLVYFWPVWPRVIVCERGIITFWGRIRAHRWEDISVVYQGRGPSALPLDLRTSARRIVVVSRKGGAFIFDADYERFPILVRWLQREVTRVLFPAALSEYREGREVGFECVTVSRTGLRFQGESIPWSKIRKVSIRREEIAFRDDKSEPLLVLPLGRIANPLLLENLLRLVIAPRENFTIRGQFHYPPPQR
jgi:hypothetical protein